MRNLQHIVKKIAGDSTPFIGNGKLTRYNDESDSWILDQMKQQKTNPIIDHKQNDKHVTDFTDHIKRRDKLARKIVGSIFHKVFIFKNYKKNEAELKLQWRVNPVFDMPKVGELVEATNALLKTSNADLKAIRANEAFTKVKIVVEEPRFFMSQQAIVRFAWVTILDSGLTEDEIKTLLLKDHSIEFVNDFVHAENKPEQQ